MNLAVDIKVYEKGRRAPEYKLNTDLRGELTLDLFFEELKEILIITADQVLKEEQQAGFDKNPIVVVDGRENRNIRTVSPLGKIQFFARANMSTIVLDTYMGILNRSPVLTGRYKSSHYVFLNGKQVATDLDSLRRWLASGPEFKATDLIRFVNIQPYARKLERLGVTDQRQQSRRVASRDKRKAAQGKTILAPNGAYFLTTRIIRLKYKRNSVIKFSFISGAQLGIKGSFKTGPPRGIGRPYLYPTITISVSEKGII